MRSRQAFHRIRSTVINFDLPGILQDHPAGKNHIVAEPARGLIQRLRCQQRRCRPADDPARIFKIKQHNPGGIALLPAVFPAVLAPAAVKIHGMECRQPALVRLKGRGAGTHLVIGIRHILDSQQQLVTPQYFRSGESLIHMSKRSSPPLL